MKRIWFGVLLLALLLVLSTVSSAGMKKTWDPQSKNLAAAARLAAAGSWEEADRLWLEAAREWNRREPLTAALCHHQTIDEISGLFARLEVFSSARSTVPFRSTCVCLAQLLDSLAKSHSFTLKNLF